jgi:hypothetical protein
MPGPARASTHARQHENQRDVPHLDDDSDAEKIAARAVDAAAGRF